MSSGSEIERKYLLERLPAGVEWESEREISQGYVALDGDTEVRVRLSGTSATLTIKGGTGRVRSEEELELGERAGAALWELTRERRVEKVRRVTHAGGHAIEVDEYRGALAGLLVAEVEFADEAAAEAFTAPGWFGAEVTDDARYANRSLACDGLPGGRE